MSNIGQTESHFGVIEPYNNVLALTKHSALIGAIEIAGRDADGLTLQDHAALSAIAQSINSKLPRGIQITQYYAHFDGVKVSVRRRVDPVSDTLSRQRENYLNSLQLSGSKIVHYFEIEPIENLNKLNALDKLRHIGMAVFDKRSRLLLKNSISFDKMFLIDREQLETMARQLQDAINEVNLKWNGLFSSRQLTMQEIYAHMRFLASLNPADLQIGLTEAVPEEDMDLCMSSGDISTINADKMDVLKFSGATTQYAKIASVRRFSNKRRRMQPGLWAANDRAPIRLTGNYIIMTRWQPMSELKKDWMFTKKNTELERQSLNFFNMLTGADTPSALEKQASMKPGIKKKIEELGIAESLPDVWGIGNSTIIVFGDDTKKIRETVTELKSVLGNAQLNVTWESIEAEEVFTAFQPGQGRESIRDLYLTASQFAAASLIYQSSIGQPIVKDMQKEEAAYIFRSKDGTPFYYSPFINGRAMTIGVGPIRKGKTFLKNTLATHSQKYGGIYRAIDIDPGTEPIAGIFGNDAGIFRASNDAQSGSNPFASCRGPDDVNFKIHLQNLMNLFLEANDSKSLKSIDEFEQRALDAAVDRTINLPVELRTLSALVAGMPESLKLKFSRWVKPADQNQGNQAGWFAHLFDNERDAIGSLTKRIGVFNLQALKDAPVIIRPVLADILYRITQSFENPNTRHIPKTLDIDECHHVLGLPTIPEAIELWVRTWGKWFGTVQLWTQSPRELSDVKGWPALRSAATTFFFFSDPELDEAVYIKAFPFLTSGQLDAIKSLIPQKEAYLIQPEIGVSKVIVIDVEPAQRVVNTSHPQEATLRDSLIKQYGFQEGLRRAVIELEPKLIRDPEDDIYSRLSLTA